jgi:Zn-finger nucleic acid-binding protein
MAVYRFLRRLDGEVTLDPCFVCRGIWFEEYESDQLASAGVLELFRLLHQHHADLRHNQRARSLANCQQRRDLLDSELSDPVLGGIEIALAPLKR